MDDELNFDFEHQLEDTIDALPAPAMKEGGAAAGPGGRQLAVVQPGGGALVVAPEPEAPKEKNYRQTVCAFWLKGMCMKGESCGFLHKFDPERMPVCRVWMKSGECREIECPFKHSLDDVKECNMFKLGFCIYGPHCRYKHTKQPGPPPDPSDVEAAKPREHRDWRKMGGDGDGDGGGGGQHRHGAWQRGNKRQRANNDVLALPAPQQQQQQQQQQRHQQQQVAPPAPPPGAPPQHYQQQQHMNGGDGLPQQQQQQQQLPHAMQMGRGGPGGPGGPGAPPMGPGYLSGPGGGFPMPNPAMMMMGQMMSSMMAAAAAATGGGGGGVPPPAPPPPMRGPPGGWGGGGGGGGY